MADIDDESLSANTVLSRILSCSNEYFNFRSIESDSSTATPPHIHVNLPEPSPILSTLVAAGAAPEFAHAMQAAYYQRVREFQERALATISRACSKLTQLSSQPSNETIMVAFQQVYYKKLSSRISESVALLQAKGLSASRCRDDNESASIKTSKAFNHQYVPLLDQFFEKNQFPTHADKVFLANKSNMTYRQIHVWFQNRRNRRKKALHKKPASEEATIPLDTVIRRMDKSVTSPITGQGTRSCGPRISVSSPITEVVDVLGGGVAPSHAFPTAYPPNCEYDPFPGAPIFRVPEWSRRPAIPLQCSRQSKINVEELAEKFSQLNVWDDSVSRSRRKAGFVTWDSFAATCAITVRPPPAPHPACIRTATVSPTLPPMICRPISAPASAMHAFRSPSPDSPMATLIPQHIGRRRICPIPKRIPGPPLTLDRESSGRLNGSPLTPSARSSSVGSGISRCNKSDHNWSSTSSSITTTPESSPSLLSHPI